jgi:hypothetical protein
MSRWLKSVNNLLETLDGQAENVAAGDIDDTAIGQLIDSGKNVLRGNSGNASSDDEYDQSMYTEDEYDDDEFTDEGLLDSDDYDDDDEEEEEDFEETEDDDELGSLSSEPAPETSTPTARQEQQQVSAPIQEQISTAATASKSTGAGDRPDYRSGSEISEISYSEDADFEDAIMEEDISAFKVNEGPRSVDGLDSIDQSPSIPRRSLEVSNMNMKALPPGVMLHDLDDDVPEQGKAASSSSLDEIDPPKKPKRQISLPSQKQPPFQKAGSPKSEPLSTLSVPVDEMQTVPSLNHPNKTAGAAQGAAVPTRPPKRVANKEKEKIETQNLLVKVQALQSQLKKTSQELKTSQAETKKLSKQVKTLTTKLETSDAEIHAQREELLRAGERMEKDRARAQEEREDILDDHEEEVEQLKEAHQVELADQKARYEKQIQDLESRLKHEETQRMQEGGDWTKELEDALQRERDALKRLSEVETEKSTLQSKCSKLEMQQTSLQSKIESLTQTSKTAADREREAEDKLDAAKALHARQLAQRQARESELEQTISELGVALTVSRQKEGSAPKQARSEPALDDGSYKEKYKIAQDEVETLKVQLSMETQRREALQLELNDISKERTEEAASVQARQQASDRKIADLEANVARLQLSLREQKQDRSISGQAPKTDARTSQLENELEAAKSEVSKLSEQLLRLQNRAESSKSEILALKGRLQSATARAEAAEKSASAQLSAPSNTNQMYEMEGGIPVGNLATRRRVKGGAGRYRGASSSVRSIRSALNLGHGRSSPALQQVLTTVDAIDSWMVETGSFMRHEPLARLGFLLYLMTLHVWTFALVVFHETEVPHGDFGSMGNSPRHWRDHGS